MTREEAIHILEIELKAERFVRKCFDEPIHNARTEALNIAIEALRQDERPKGRWEEPTEEGLPDEFTGLGVVCSCCSSWADNPFNYCPNCGADMRGEEE